MFLIAASAICVIRLERVPVTRTFPLALNGTRASVTALLCPEDACVIGHDAS